MSGRARVAAKRGRLARKRARQARPAVEPEPLPCICGGTGVVRVRIVDAGPNPATVRIAGWGDVTVAVAGGGAVLCGCR